MKPLKWVIEGIKVRVVSKKAAQGKLYGKIVNVRTVHDAFKFDAKEPGSYEILGDLREKDIETVLPSSKDLQGGVNTAVMLLRGEHRGKVGKVLTIDKKKDVVSVQVDICDIAQVSQDDCSLVV